MPSSKSKLIIFIAALVALAIWTGTTFPRSDVLTVTFLDVGEGLCTVVITPSGKTMVMDCGTSSWRNNDSIGERLAATYLQQHGVDAIDVAVLSHPHEDHISGLGSLLAVKPAKLVLDIGAKHPSTYYREFLKQVEISGARYRIAVRGQSLDMGDGVRVEILNPGPNTTYSDLNNQSAVLRVTYKKTSFMLAADAEEEAERDIIESGADLHSQVLQVGHHGSRSSSSTDWLDAVRPKIAVISCGYHNRYGHPAPQAIERLQSSGARIYRTDRQGAVQLTSDGQTIRVETFKRLK